MARERCCRCTTPAIRDTSRRRSIGDLGIPPETFNLHQLEWYGKVNFLKGGLAFCDYAVTVSPSHADELRTPAGGFGLHEMFTHMGDRFSGNHQWDRPGSLEPRDRHGDRRELHAAGHVEQSGLQGRAAADVRSASAQGRADHRHVQPAREAERIRHHSAERGGESPRRAVCLSRAGRGAIQRWLQTLSSETAGARKRGVSLHRQSRAPPDRRLRHAADAVGVRAVRSDADARAALRRARRSGGASAESADTVHDDATGFLFDAFTPNAFDQAVGRAHCIGTTTSEAWEPAMYEAMGRDFGWDSSATRYVQMYRRALARANPGELSAMDFVLALHSHLPYVLNHGRWPHGSDWITEAAVDTYLPLIDSCEALAEEEIAAPVTVGHHADSGESAGKSGFRERAATVLPAEARRVRRSGNRDGDQSRCASDSRRALLARATHCDSSSFTIR